jgi:hypothetical protein
VRDSGLARNGEAEARAAGLPPLVEALEDDWQLLGGNAAAVSMTRWALSFNHVLQNYGDRG